MKPALSSVVEAARRTWSPCCILAISRGKAGPFQRLDREAYCPFQRLCRYSHFAGWAGGPGEEVQAEVLIADGRTGCDLVDCCVPSSGRWFLVSYRHHSQSSNCFLWGLQVLGRCVLGPGE